MTEQTLRDRAWQYDDRPLFLPAQLISLAPFTTFAALSLVLFFGWPWQYLRYLSLAIVIDAVNYLLSIATPLRKPRVINIAPSAGKAGTAGRAAAAITTIATAVTAAPVAKPGGAASDPKAGLTPLDWWMTGVIAFLVATYLARLGYYFYEDVLTHLLRKLQIVDYLVAVEKVFPFTREVRTVMFNYEYGFATFKEFLAQINIIGLLLVMEAGFLVPLLRGYVEGGYGPAAIARAAKAPVGAEIPDPALIRKKNRFSASALLLINTVIPAPFVLVVIGCISLGTPLRPPFDRYHVLSLPPTFIGAMFAAMLFFVTFRIALRRNTLRYLKANGLLATAPRPRKHPAPSHGFVNAPRRRKHVRPTRALD